MATIKDIAGKTGLGLATISKYLNGGTVREPNRLAIEAAIEELGFTVNEFARGLKTSRSRTVGVIIPELSNIFVTTIITAVEDILQRNGYGILVCDCRTDEAAERDAVRFLLAKQVDGIINMPVSSAGAHLAPAIDKGVPVVLVDRMISSYRERVNGVLVDNVGAAAAATELLLEAGHTGIGIILGPREVFTTRQRLLGYHQALLSRALSPHDAMIHYRDYTVQGGYEGMKRLLERPDITAVFVTNYEMTLGAIIAINELGVRVPEQISLIGFDNLQLSQVIRPRLTIVTQPLEEIGEAVAGILLDRLGEGGELLEPTILTLGASIQKGESIRDITPHS